MARTLTNLWGLLDSPAEQQARRTRNLAEKIRADASSVLIRAVNRSSDRPADLKQIRQVYETAAEIDPVETAAGLDIL